MTSIEFKIESASDEPLTEHQICMAASAATLRIALDTMRTLGMDDAPGLARLVVGQVQMVANNLQDASGAKYTEVRREPTTIVRQGGEWVCKVCGTAYSGEGDPPLGHRCGGAGIA